MAYALESGEEILTVRKDRIEADVALPIFRASENLGLQLIMLAEEQAFADSDLAARAYQTLPVIRIGRELMGQQNLDTPV